MLTLACMLAANIAFHTSSAVATIAACETTETCSDTPVSLLQVDVQMVQRTSISKTISHTTKSVEDEFVHVPAQASKVTQSTNSPHKTSSHTTKPAEHELVRIPAQASKVNHSTKLALQQGYVNCNSWSEDFRSTCSACIYECYGDVDCGSDQCGGDCVWDPQFEKCQKKSSETADEGPACSCAWSATSCDDYKPMVSPGGCASTCGAYTQGILEGLYCGASNGLVHVPASKAAKLKHKAPKRKDVLIESRKKSVKA